MKGKHQSQGDTCRWEEISKRLKKLKNILTPKVNLKSLDQTPNHDSCIILNNIIGDNY